MKNKLALVVAVLLGLIAVYGVAHYIGQQESQFKKKYRTARVAAAAKRIPAGTIIEPNMLLKEEQGGQVVGLGIEMSDAAITQENIMVADEDRLIGQRINRSVERGEPLLVSYFRQPIEKLDSKLAPGQRAVTLHVDAIAGVSGNIAPDSHVDIIGTFPLPGAGTAAAGRMSGAAGTHTVLVLSNVSILALDNRTRDEDYAVSATGGQRSRSYSSVTVAVTPEEANLLVFAQQYGALTLALRSPADSTAASGQIEIKEGNVLDLAAKADAERQKRLKDFTPIMTTPATP